MAKRKSKDQLPLIVDNDAFSFPNVARPVCTHNHEETPSLEADLRDLPKSQRGHWRHACAACAYEAGLAAGRARGYREALQDIKK